MHFHVLVRQLSKEKSIKQSQRCTGHISPGNLRMADPFHLNATARFLGEFLQEADQQEEERREDIRTFQIVMRSLCGWSVLLCLAGLLTRDSTFLTAGITMAIGAWSVW